MFVHIKGGNPIARNECTRRETATENAEEASKASRSQEKGKGKEKPAKKEVRGPPNGEKQVPAAPEAAE